MIVVIASGLPGAGKSTLLKRLYANPKIVSADHFFMIDCPLCGGKTPTQEQALDSEDPLPVCGRCKGKGEIYNFESGKMGLAHSDCLRKYVELLQAHPTEFDALIVDNTNTSEHEMSPYVHLAQAYGYRCIIITITCDFETALSRNVHSVPETVLRRMAKNLQERKIPLWWDHIQISVE